MAVRSSGSSNSDLINNLIGKNSSFLTKTEPNFIFIFFDS